MKPNFPVITISLALFAGLIASPAELNAQDWHKVSSKDGKASVMFPVPLDESKLLVTTDKTPAGTATTRVLEYQDKGMMFTISSTELPGLAVLLAGEDTILGESKKGLLSKAFSKETSWVQYDGIKSPEVMLLKYESSNFQQKGHPGFTGFAVLFVIKKNLYVINSMLEKGTDEATTKKNAAAQEKLLKSIQINP